MITDALCQLSGTFNGTTATGQAVNGAGNILSTNTYDLGVARDIGKGEMLEAVFEIVTAPTAGTSVQFQLIQADDAALTTNVQVIVQSDAIPIASLPAGTQVPLHVDRVDPYPARRYLGARYVNVGAIATQTIFATLVKSVADKQVNYTNGFAVL